jgi:curved DNA-binding protein CbpA
MKTAYDVLGVHRNASHETIRTAFRKAAKACHPDLNVSDPTAELQVRVVITAYEILKNPQKRAAYDRHFRERRRERARHFGMATVANLLRASLVALAVAASVSPSSTHDASAPSTPQSASAKIRLDGSQQAAATENPGRQELDKARKSDWGAALEDVPRYRAAVGSFALTAGFPEAYASDPGSFAGAAHHTTAVSGNSKLGSDTAPSDSRSRILNESGSVGERYRQEGEGHTHNPPIKVAAHQHRNDGRITSAASPSRDQRGVKSTRRTSIGARDRFILPRGPSELVALVVSKIAMAKTSSAPHAKVVGGGARMGSYKTRQIAGSNRTEAASENSHRLYRIPNSSGAKAIERNKFASRSTS